MRTITTALRIISSFSILFFCIHCQGGKLADFPNLFEASTGENTQSSEPTDTDENTKNNDSENSSSENKNSNPNENETPTPQNPPQGNQAPIAKNVTQVINQKDFKGKVCPNHLIKTDINLVATDPENDSLTYFITTESTKGSVSISGNKATYFPHQNDFATDSFSYVAYDGENFSKPAFVTLSTVEIQSSQFADTFATFGTVMQGKAGTFTEDFGVQAPTVIYNPNTRQYIMYFETRYQATDTRCPNGLWGVGRAVSENGIDWIQDDNLIFSQPDDSPYECIIAHPAAIFDGETYHLFFKMHTPSGQDGIGYATSEDSQNFGAIRKIASGVKSFPSAILHNETIYLYYWAQHGTNFSIDMMWSENQGVNWDEDLQSVKEMHLAQGVWSQNTLWSDVKRFPALSALCNSQSASPFEMIISGFNPSGDFENDLFPQRVGGSFASIDGINWSLSDTAETVPNPFWWRHLEVLKEKNNYLMWYSDILDDGQKVIRFATTLDEWP